MARQSVVEMDFLGVEKGPEIKGSSQNERNSSTLVKPTASLPNSKDQTPWSHTLSAGSVAGAGSSPLSCPQAAAYPKGRSWTMAEGKEGSGASPPPPQQKQSGGVDRPTLDKPFEELSDADIMQLTREDCRRYLKEKGMRRPSWNKFQAIQQVLSLKGLFDSKSEKDIQKEDSSSPKDCPEVASDAMLPLLKAEANSQIEQGVTGVSKEVHSFFGSAKEGFALATVQKKGSFADGQCRLPQVMDEKHGSSCPPDSSTSSLLNSNLTLSPPAAWEKGPTTIAGFGSPLPIYLTSRERPVSLFTTVQNTAARNVQGRSPSQGLQTSELGARSSSAHARLPTAQLTIFYAGLVNVYDEIPADKAQAIMLLAGSGNQWAASAGMRPPPAIIEYPVSAPPIVATSPSVPASSPAGDHCKEGMPPPVPAAVFSPAPITQQCVVRRPHSELPQARKVSLQRFLEKRKERALANAPYLVAKKVETEDSSPIWDQASDMSPCLSKAVEARSASPVTLPQHSLSGAHAIQSCGSENSSPRAPRVEEIVLNSKERGCAGVEVEKQYEKSETVNSVDEKMMEIEEDAASSQV